MRRQKASLGYAAFTLIELVVVMAMLSTVSVAVYLPLRDGIRTLRTSRQCQVVQGQFGVVFDRVMLEMSQAGTVLNVDPGTHPGGGAAAYGTVDDGDVKWLTYQTLSGSLRLVYYSPSVTVSGGGDLFYYDFPSNPVTDPGGVAAHNTFVGAHTPITGTEPALPTGALPLARNLYGFAINLFAVSTSGFVSASHIATADVLRLEAKPNVRECATMPPLQADIALRNQGRGAANLVISEVMYETTTDDYVEILNPLSVSVNLNTMILHYTPASTGVSISIALPNRTLEPGERMILANAAGSLNPAKRSFPVTMLTNTVATNGSLPADIERTGEFLLEDPLSGGYDQKTYGMSGCADVAWPGAASGFTACEDYMRYGTLVYEDFEWGNNSVNLSQSDTLGNAHGWILSDSGSLSSSYLGLTHRRIGETISGSGTLREQAVLLPSIDANGNASGGVLASFEVSGQKALGDRWWLENTQHLVLPGARTVRVKFANLREFDVDNDADREFAIEYCEDSSACWNTHAGAGWTAINADIITNTTQVSSPAAEMRAQLAQGYHQYEANVALGAGTYKFRMRFKTHTNYATP